MIYKKRLSSGFTLIELVIVIVILGILAAAALPRFSDLSTDARIAALNGLMGSVRSGAAIAHATQLVLAGATSGTPVTLDGQNVDMLAGYPSASGISAALTDYSGFTFTSAGASATFTLRGNCLVKYIPSTGAGVSVYTTTSGC